MVLVACKSRPPACDTYLQTSTAMLWALTLSSITASMCKGCFAALLPNHTDSDRSRDDYRRFLSKQSSKVLYVRIQQVRMHYDALRAISAWLFEMCTYISDWNYRRATSVLYMLVFVLNSGVNRVSRYVSYLDGLTQRAERCWCRTIPF